MVINQFSTIELTRGELTVSTPVEDGNVLEAKIKYVEHQDVRDSVQAIAIALVQECSKELLVDKCGQCGTCCKTFAVPVNAREILKITQHLNMSSEDEFRAKFTTPVCTWNEKDGMIRRIENHCIFLEHQSAEKYRCTIYPVRPLFCSTLVPLLPFCRKTPEKLLYYLERITIKGDCVTVDSKTGSVREKRIESVELREALQVLFTQVSAIDENTVDKLAYISQEAKRITDELFNEFFSHGHTEKFQDRVQAMEEVIADLECLTSLPAKDPDALEELKRKIGHIRDLMEGRTPPRDLVRNSSKQATVGIPSDESPVKGLRFLSEALQVLGFADGKVFQRIIPYGADEEMAGNARKLLNMLFSIEDLNLQKALEHKTPECFMCGECCRQYSVEISPFDIERIGENFALTEEEVWEKFLEKGRFSWNPKNGIFKRVTNERGQRDCVFLRRKFEGIYYCSIYDVRPQICRDYSPTNKLCRRTSLRQKSHTHMSNIVCIDLIGDVLYLTTHYTLSLTLEPVAISIKCDERLSRLCRVIKRRALDIMAPVIVSQESLVPSSAAGVE